MSDLFVSWAGSHARNIGELIRDLFAPFSNDYNVFLSSRDLPSGKDWRSNLLQKLHAADDGLIIFTQESIKSDWQLHESAVLSARTQELDIFMLEAPRTMLPLPLQDIQCTDLDYQSLEVWVDKVVRNRSLALDRRRKEAFLKDADALIQDYKKKHVTGADPRWIGTLSHPIAISSQGGSPYELSEIIRIARQRIVLIAQNHRYMTDPYGQADVFRDSIFDKLRAGVKVDIVAMHPSIRPKGAEEIDATKVWGFVSGSNSFDDHLSDCWETLGQWAAAYKEKSSQFSGKLRIMGAYMIPMSLNAIDPETDDGFLVLSPRLTDQYANYPRPQFIVTRRHESGAFNFFWSNVSTSFDNAGWKDPGLVKK